MYVINFPSAGASWLYDGSTSYWSSLVSTGQTRHIGEFSIDFSSIPRIADFSNGNLYNLSPTGLTENGTNLNRIIVSETVASPDGNRITVNKLRLDIEVGNGLAVGQGSNPVIGLEISRDNGKTYGAQMWQRMGAVGDFKRRVEWTRLGTAYNFVFRLTVSDPVNFVLVSASINPDD